MEQKRKALVVVAIDFGTTYSGYAYSFHSEYLQNQTQIYSNNQWKTGDGLVTSKTPTVILFDRENRFHKFGYEAETKYNELFDVGNATGWRYFKLFKMKLFKTEDAVLRRTRADRITTQLLLEDEEGKPMSAMIVFSECIRYLKNHFLENTQVRGLNLQVETDVHWVLTVPAIWTDGAKQFMRKSAQMAGIEDSMLTLAYEPEAAAIYCKALIVQRKAGAECNSLTSFDPGQQFLVLDCGGGTVDITAYEIQGDGHLKELLQPTGGPWGGTCVNTQYLSFLQDLVGHDVWGEYILEQREDFLKIQRRFEAKKKSVLSSSEDRTTIAFPFSLFTKYEISKQCTSLQEDLKKSRYASSIEVKNEKMRFDHRLVKCFFQRPVESIVFHLKAILQKPELENIKTILMVGGFSDSSLLSERIISEFCNKTVICPKEAVDAIMKGAVIFGHNPDLISERVSPRTYGISVNKPFNKRVHPLQYKVEYDGKVMCTDIFETIVKIGHPILVGKSIFSYKCLPTRSTDTEATIEFYESKSESPKYTLDDGVRRLGNLTVSIPDTSKGKNRPIIIEVSFGYTELTVSAHEEGTNNKAATKFDCLLN